ncbi:MAG: cytochrome C [Planctomycetaceae bacterium]|nr:cytochrome C [Planctomycetaceae bacterium]
MRTFVWIGFCGLVSALVATGIVARCSSQETLREPGSNEQEQRRADQQQYAGSQECVKCHRTHYDGWRDSAHNKMIRPAIAEGPRRTILADFNQDSPDRNFDLKDVKWVIGHRWKQRFIGEIDGQEVVFPAQWSVEEKKWQSYGGRSDWWYPHHKDWRQRSNFKLCGGCHGTGVDVRAESWTELNIACESCHGPGKAHVEEPLVTNIVNPSRLSRDRSIEVCLSCHQAGKPAGTEFAWPVGYQPGMELAEFWTGFEPEAGEQTAEFWHNGTAHKNRVQGNTFLQSTMYESGMQCSDCHDSHGSRHASMTVKSAETNALCLTCHAPGKISGLEYKTISEHTHHAPESAGSRCIECHMPKIGKNSVMGESRDHTFKFISPADTIKHGAPNGCNVCHADKTPKWALSELEKWSQTDK